MEKGLVVSLKYGVYEVQVEDKIFHILIPLFLKNFFVVAALNYSCIFFFNSRREKILSLMPS